MSTFFFLWPYGVTAIIEAIPLALETLAEAADNWAAPKSGNAREVLRSLAVEPTATLPEGTR